MGRRRKQQLVYDASKLPSTGLTARQFQSRSADKHLKDLQIWVSEVWGPAGKDDKYGFQFNRLPENLVKEFLSFYRPCYQRRYPARTIGVGFARAFAAHMHQQKVNWRDIAKSRARRARNNVIDRQVVSNSTSQDSSSDEDEQPEQEQHQKEEQEQHQEEQRGDGSVIRTWVLRCKEEIRIHELHKQELVAKKKDNERQCENLKTRCETLEQLVVSDGSLPAAAVINSTTLRALNMLKENRDEFKAAKDELRKNNNDLEKLEAKLVFLNSKKRMLQESPDQIVATIPFPSCQEPNEKKQLTKFLLNIEIHRCPFCQGPFNPGCFGAVVTPCFHVYHFYCAGQAFRSPKPVCVDLQCNKEIPSEWLKEFGVQQAENELHNAGVHAAINIESSDTSMRTRDKTRKKSCFDFSRLSPEQANEAQGINHHKDKIKGVMDGDCFEVNSNTSMKTEEHNTSMKTGESARQIDFSVKPISIRKNPDRVGRRQKTPTSDTSNLYHGN